MLDIEVSYLAYLRRIFFLNNAEIGRKDHKSSGSVMTG